MKRKYYFLIAMIVGVIGLVVGAREVEMHPIHHSKWVKVKLHERIIVPRGESSADMVLVGVDETGTYRSVYTDIVGYSKFKKGYLRMFRIPLTEIDPNHPDLAREQWHSFWAFVFVLLALIGAIGWLLIYIDSK